MTIVLKNEEQRHRMEPPRGRWGWYKLPTPDGGFDTFQRMTTLAKVLDSQDGLMKWESRLIVLGLGRRDDLVQLARTADPDNKKQLAQIAADAKEAGGGSAKANYGTAIHSAVENSVLGGPVPAELQPYVDKFHKMLDEAGFEVVPELVERTVVNHSHGYAGTFDYVLRRRSDGRLFLADVKTGSVDYPRGFAVQLAGYRAAEWMVSLDFQSLEPMPEPLDSMTALIVHLPLDDPEGGGLHLLDIGEGELALTHALWVRGWRRNNDLLTPFTVSEPVFEAEPVVEPEPSEVSVLSADEVIDKAEWVTDRYNALLEHAGLSGNQIRAVWPSDIPGPRKAAEMTADELVKADAALQILEDAHQAPFPPPDPDSSGLEPRSAEPAAPVPALPSVLPGPADVDTVPIEDAEALQKRLQALPDSQKQQVLEWATQGAQAGRPWRMGKDAAGVKRRNWAICCAALWLAPHCGGDDDQARMWLTLIPELDDTVIDHYPPGALLGCLSFDEAERFADLCRLDSYGLAAAAQHQFA